MWAVLATFACADATPGEGCALWSRLIAPPGGWLFWFVGGLGVFSFDHFLGEPDGTALGTRVHVQFRRPAEGGHPHVQR